MRRVVVVVVAAGLGWPGAGWAQPAAVDGGWAATVTCPPAADAAGYELRFPVTITVGVVSGEHGSPGAPGYLRLSGRLGPDGTGVLVAEGLVGSPRVAVGRLAAATPYRYSATARFGAREGTATRTTGRACALAFVRP